MAQLQLERNGALFGVHGLVRPKVLDGNDIVRDAMFRQLRTRAGNPGTTRSLVPTAKRLLHLCETTNFWFSKEVNVLVMAEESVHVIRVR